MTADSYQHLACKHCHHNNFPHRHSYGASSLPLSPDLGVACRASAAGLVVEPEE